MNTGDLNAAEKISVGFCVSVRLTEVIRRSESADLHKLLVPWTPLQHGCSALRTHETRHETARPRSQRHCAGLTGASSTLHVCLHRSVCVCLASLHLQQALWLQRETLIQLKVTTVWTGQGNNCWFLLVLTVLSEKGGRDQTHPGAQPGSEALNLHGIILHGNLCHNISRFSLSHFCLIGLWITWARISKISQLNPFIPVLCNGAPCWSRRGEKWPAKTRWRYAAATNSASYTKLHTI